MDEDDDDETKREECEIVKLINLDGHDDDASRFVSGFMGILHFGKVLTRHRGYGPVCDEILSTSSDSCLGC